MLPPVVTGLIIGKERAPKIARGIGSFLWLIMLIIIAIIIIFLLSKRK